MSTELPFSYRFHIISVTCWTGTSVSTVETNDEKISQSLHSWCQTITLTYWICILEENTCVLNVTLILCGLTFLTVKWSRITHCFFNLVIFTVHLSDRILAWVITMGISYLFINFLDQKIRTILLGSTILAHLHNLKKAVKLPNLLHNTVSVSGNEIHPISTGMTDTRHVIVFNSSLIK